MSPAHILASLPASTAGATPALVSPPVQATGLGPIASLVSAFMAVVTAPFAFLQGGPTAPGGPLGSLLQFLYVARRQFQSFFFNSTPTLAPTQYLTIAAGSTGTTAGTTVTGTLGGFDADGDALIYSVTRGPTNGTVTIDGQGGYVYTPNAAMAATGGIDTFDVSVSDATNFHFHGLQDILTLGGLLNGVLGLPDPNVAKATVSVVVAPANSVSSIAVGRTPEGVALSADGSRTYVADSGGNSVSVIDNATKTVIATIADVGQTPVGIAAGTAGKIYVANQFGNSVSVIDTATNTVAATIAVGDTPQALTVSADGGRVYVANTQGNTVSVIDTTTNAVVSTIAVGVSPQGIAVSPDGTRVYVANSLDPNGGSVSVVDSATNSVIATVALGSISSPQAVTVSADGRKVYVAEFDRGTVSVIDSATNSVVSTIGVGAFPDAVAIDPTGTRLYVTNSLDNTVAMIDTATNLRLGTIDLGDTGAGLAINADGTRLYATNPDTGTLSVVAVSPAAPSMPGSELGVLFKTYFVYNLTGRPVTLVDYKYGEFPEVGPQIGTVIPFGGSMTFSVQLRTAIAPVFSSVTGDLTNIYEAGLAPGTDFARCRGAGGDGRCTGVGEYGVILEPLEGTTLEVPSTDSTGQSGVLNALCRDFANCRLLTGNAYHVLNAGTIEGNKVLNNSPGFNNEAVAFTYTQTHTISVSVSTTVGGKIAGVVNLAFTATFGYSYTTSRSETETVMVGIPPYGQAFVAKTQPVLRLYGDFTVQYKGATFLLKDVYFDAPDPTQDPVRTINVARTDPPFP